VANKTTTPMNPTDLLTDHFRLNSQQKLALKKLKIETVNDLLFHFPTRYGDITSIKRVSELKVDESVTLYCRVQSLQTGKTFKGKVPHSRAVVADETGRLEVIWFHQPYIAKMIEVGSLVKLDGKVTSKKEKLSLINPNTQVVNQAPDTRGFSLFGQDPTGFMQPVYPERKGLSSNWIFQTIKKILLSDLLDKLTDPVPEKLLKQYKLPSLKTALFWIHTPKRQADAEIARKRFSFQEIFLIQLKRQLDRKNRESQGSFQIEKPELKKDEFLTHLPFKPTEAQDRAINNIIKDMARDKPMSRLLEGDVGSGKTVVAAAAAYTVVNTEPNQQGFGSLQVAYMVPTEILARQQFESFIENFKHLPIHIGLLTSSGCRKFPSKVDPERSTNISKTQLLKWIHNGEIAIVIGTHSLIQEKVKFKNLAFVIIDEQHRFGTIQRQNLLRKDNITPHLLSMTATPIPRTLALTIYGDLDLTVLDQLPPGRQTPITKIVEPHGRSKMFDQIKELIKTGRQAYVICPRIDEADPDQARSLQVASVKAETKHLKEEVFKKHRVEMLHGQMKPSDKEKVMTSWEQGLIDVLVSTSVIEVGVNVPNATVMIIEGAERFGLAQLHQLRGRIQRSSHQSYCFVCSDSDNEKSLKRLKALQKAQNGFELAEYDLAQRGAGELSGHKQWGISDLAMEALKNIKMVEAARDGARSIITKDPKLNKKDHRHLTEHLEKIETHFE